MKTAVKNAIGLRLSDHAELIDTTIGEMAFNLLIPATNPATNGLLLKEDEDAFKLRENRLASYISDLFNDNPTLTIARFQEAKTSIIPKLQQILHRNFPDIWDVRNSLFTFTKERSFGMLTIYNQQKYILLKKPNELELLLRSFPTLSSRAQGITLKERKTGKIRYVFNCHLYYKSPLAQIHNDIRALCAKIPADALLTFGGDTNKPAEMLAQALYDEGTIRYYNANGISRSSQGEGSYTRESHVDVLMSREVPRLFSL